MGYSLAPCPDLTSPHSKASDLGEGSKLSTDTLQHSEALALQRVSIARKIVREDALSNSSPLITASTSRLPPPDKKRPKSPVSLPSRTSYILSKQLKQMLKIRHTPAPEAHSSGPRFTDHVTVRNISDGRTYLQINLDREQIRDLCSPSTYQINSPWPVSARLTTAENPAKTTASTSNSLGRYDKPATKRAVSVPPSQRIDSSGLGIMNDYPHLVLEETQNEDRVNTESQTRCTPVALISVPRLVTGVPLREHGSTPYSKTSGQQSHHDGRQPNLVGCGQYSDPETVPTRGVRPRPATMNQSINLDALATEQPKPPLSQQNSPPYAVRMRSAEHTKQNSNGTAISMSPRKNGHSKNSSAQSACGSFADDGQSDTSSGIVMNAQSAELIRAHGLSGFSCGAPRIKPPRPGPAPTRALPSLPEGYDIANGVKSANDTERAFPHIGPSLERSTIKVPQRSPARIRRPPALKIVAPSKFRSPSWISATNGVPQCSPQKSTYGTPATSGSTAPITDPSSADIESDALKRWKRQRAETTKALKKRDLEQARALDQEKEHIDPLNVNRPLGAILADKSDEQVRALPSVSGPYLSQNISVGSRIESTSLNELSCSQLTKKPKHHLNAIGNCISPILLIAEQVPTEGILSDGHISRPSPLFERSSLQLFRNGISKSKTETPGLDITRPPPALLPSPIEDISQNHHSRQPPKPNQFIPVPLSSKVDSTARDPHPHQPSVPTTPAPTIESRLSTVENLIAILQSTLERKNLLLEAAAFAFLSSSTGCGAQGSLGDRSSGLSARSEMSGIWEKGLESRLEAMLGLVSAKGGKEEGRYG